MNQPLPKLVKGKKKNRTPTVDELLTYSALSIYFGAYNRIRMYINDFYDSSESHKLNTVSDIMGREEYKSG